MITDIYVEENFITEQERLAVKQFVLDHKPYWSNHRPERYSGVDFKTLGNALYIMEAELVAAADINQEVKSLLTNNMSWLYQRLCDKIASLTGIETRLHPYLTVPGFHIADVPGNITDDTISFFHQDMSILTYDKESNMETNRSVLVSIQDPSSGAYLLYKDHDQIKKLHYKHCAFQHWDARMEHKIGAMRLLPGEHRITLQSHYYYNARMQCNLIYF